MIDISDKEGDISYNVNLYSEVIALADVLGERTFSQLWKEHFPSNAISPPVGKWFFQRHFFNHATFLHI